MRDAFCLSMRFNIKSFPEMQPKDISFVMDGKRVYLKAEGRDSNGDMWCSDARGSRFVFSTLLAARDMNALTVVR